MKKILILLIVILSFVLLVSCGQLPDNPREEDNVVIVWSDYIKMEDQTVLEDGKNHTLYTKTLKSLPKGYKVVADGDTTFKEAGEYTIKYNVVDSEGNVVYSVSAKLTIEEVVVTDYASQVTLDNTSGRLQTEATVKQYIDGDTTHFYVSTSVVESGILKARYIAVDTPESTGKIEPWGKKASNYTKSKLESAESIILESDTATWNVDSTGGRHLVWVWYRPEGSNSYRNLNIELLQEGYAKGSNAEQNSYGQTAGAAIRQAQALKLRVQSSEKDPDFYYGKGINTTVKELIINKSEYEGKLVIFDANVYKNYNDGVFVEEYDEDAGMTFGMYVYYGKSADGSVLEALEVGNRAHIVGTLQQFNGSWQVSGLKYEMFDPEGAASTHMISSGYVAQYTETNPQSYMQDKVNIPYYVYDEELEESVEVTKELSYYEAVLYTSISMVNLRIVSIYTTNTNEDSASYGAMTFTCSVNGVTVKIRTIPFKDAQGNLITADVYENKVINIRGIVSSFNGQPQIMVYNQRDITINE